MNLTDCVWAFSSILEGMRLVSNDHNLVSNTVVVIFSSAVFAEVILIDECLSLFLKHLKVDNDRDSIKAYLSGIQYCQGTNRMSC